MSHTSSLPARVKAQNRANALVLEYYPKLAAAFAPFVGQKIEKVNGSLLEKVKKALPELPYNTREQIMRDPSNYTLRYNVQTSEMVTDHTCTYMESSIVIGELKNGVLVEIFPAPTTLRTDYTADEVCFLRASADEAEKKSREAINALGNFGRFDR